MNSKARRSLLVASAAGLLAAPMGIIGGSEPAAAAATLCRVSAQLSPATLPPDGAYVYEFAFGGGMASGTFDLNMNDNNHSGLVPQVAEVPGVDVYIGVYNASGSSQSNIAGWSEYIYAC